MPNDENEVFVANSICECSEIDEPIMRLFLITKRLLRIATKLSSHVCADATYKLIWQGYPVLIVGATDREKKFHPFGMAVTTTEDHNDFKFIFHSLKKAVELVAHPFEYNPSILIADASGAITNGFKNVFTMSNRIMCWAHMIRCVDNHLSYFS